MKQIVLIGSSVAEANPNAKASRYSAVKHTLKGLVDFIQAEQGPLPRVLLFSSGYMQTDILLPHSEPRLNDRAENPDVVAKRLIDYIKQSRK